MGRIAQEWENVTQGGGGGMQNRGRGRGGMAMGNLVLSVIRIGGGGKEMFVIFYRIKMEERE